MRTLFWRLTVPVVGLLALTVATAGPIIAQQIVVLHGLNAGLAKPLTVTAAGNLNVAGITFANGSVTAPSITFTGDTGLGFYRPGASLIAIADATSERVRFSLTNFLAVTSSTLLAWSSTSQTTGVIDTALGRNAAGIVEINNGTAGTFNDLKLRGLYTTNLAFVSTAPTISSGFGTTPSIVANNGTIAFTINVGTGGTATGGIVGLPAATTGWVCSVENRTAVAANRADQRTVQTATSTTTATIQNQTVSTGAALAFTASDILSLSCTGI